MDEDVDVLSCGILECQANGNKQLFLTCERYAIVVVSIESVYFGPRDVI